ncbi:hypothetical protein DACRYDRAFT_115710 [Dacryopinax primogenitus]|uniref:Uncharacterized protein n=1 Tax=Dacryopinax primogenitus (strain DJM 731) TaxID=1858805 RepID=M5G1Y2_DACPD|nr:uncharacterized protein DACRYDRAFT_115710 [Dacryopinax primogenitus]EJU02699.1 hypothetical protein DACRYDRAFT_115710 [Dacryopinax primogenitus]
MSSGLNEFLNHEDIRKEVAESLGKSFKQLATAPTWDNFVRACYITIFRELQESTRKFRARISRRFLKYSDDIEPWPSFDPSGEDKKWRDFMVKTFFGSKAEPKADDVIAAIQHPFIVAAFCEVKAKLEGRLDINHELASVFEIPYQNDEIRKIFIKYLEPRGVGIMEDLKTSRWVYYSRCLNIIASSGQGKSRLMKEVGYGRRDCISPTPEDEPVFCIPANIRELDAPGYPLPDPIVFKYFKTLQGRYSTDSQQSDTAHWRAAVFLSEALKHALTCLKDIPEAEYVPKLRAWNEKMEGRNREYRDQFWEDVVNNAETTYATTIINRGSPSQQKFIEPATNELVSYLSVLRGSDASVIIYFDEVAGFRNLYWILSRVLSAQRSAPLWVVFMATSGKLEDYEPPWCNISSKRSSEERVQLLPPYYSLGFDQWAQKAAESRTMGDLSTWLHASYYGRPL